MRGYPSMPLKESFNFGCKNHVMAYVRCYQGETLYRCEHCFQEVREYNDSGCGG